jgi:Domain of unknown function (DUF4411)
MSFLKPPYQYVIDSSALFDLKNLYPEEVFPSVWERVNEMCKEKLIIAPREVLREIKRGNDELLEWADRHEEIFLVPCDEELLINESVVSVYPETIILKYSTRPWADPLVIACAKHYGLPIIQHELNDPNQYKIPVVAKRFNIKCLSLVDFFKEEGWLF